VAESQRKPPRKRRPRSASGAETPAKQKRVEGNDGGGPAARGRSRKRTAPRATRQRGSGDDVHAEEWDNPEVHLEIESRRFAGGEIERRRVAGGGIERRRFAGGPAPTPELYALAREQWYRLPGAVVRPFMGPVVHGQADPDENGSDQ
jgi:hypothetical protein